MTHRLATNYAKNYCNRTPIVKVIVDKKAQLMLAYPRDANTMKKIHPFRSYNKFQSSRKSGVLVIKFLIQITSTYNNS